MMITTIWKKLLAFPLFSLVTSFAIASTMPWDVPLSKLSQNLSGSTSQSIGLIALFVAGGALVFGGTLSDFGKRITWMALALSLMLSGGAFINLFTNNTALPAATGALLY